MSSANELKDKIGQLLVVGFHGGEEGLSRLASVVSKSRAGNLILFSRNFGGPGQAGAQVERALSLVRGETGILPLVGLDQEGGIVARLREGVTPMPGAMAMAAAVEGGEIGVGDIEALAGACGRDLSSLGINWNMAPVADVNVNAANPVIGVRSFGEEPDKVAALASAFAAGMRSSGILATAKHFPGHGDTEIDSHLGLPVIPHGKPRMESIELVPFKRLIGEGIDVVMVAHALYPALESERVPATMSRRIVTDLLRGELGFKGLACSDCMEMKAVAGRFPDAAKRAVAAGMDLIVISHSEEVQIAAAESIYEAVRRGEIPESRIDEAVERVSAAKAGLGEARRKPRNANDLGASAELAKKISRASLSQLVRGEALPPAEGGYLIDVQPKNFLGVEDLKAAAGVLNSARARGWALEGEAVEPDLSIQDADAAVGRAEKAILGRVEKGGGGKAKPSLVLCLNMPIADEGQMRLVRRAARFCARRAFPLGLVLMRSPYDAEPLSKAAAEQGAEGPAVLCAYEYSALSAESVAEFLSGKTAAAGICPVTVFRGEDCTKAVSPALSRRSDSRR